MKKMLEYDQNIVDALKKLPIPLYNSKGGKIYFGTNKRHETIFQHIAKKQHHLQVRDIEKIPSIIKDLNCLYNDKKSNKCRNYYGLRSGKNRKPYLKIITILYRDKTEAITSIYPVRKKD